MKPGKTRSSIPKKAKSKPNIISLVFFIIIVIIYVPNTLFAGFMQTIVAIYLAPLAIVGLFLAYNSGIILAKYNHNRVVKNDLFLPYLLLVAIHIMCIVVCLAIEIALTGYPIMDCFDTCTTISITTAIVRYCTVSAVLFLPAYCGIYRYRRWVLKYNLTNPT